jgi:hypothetical protein
LTGSTFLSHEPGLELAVAGLVVIVNSAGGEPLGLLEIGDEREKGVPLADGGVGLGAPADLRLGSERAAAFLVIDGHAALLGIGLLG